MDRSHQPSRAPFLLLGIALGCLGTLVVLRLTPLGRDAELERIGVVRDLVAEDYVFDVTSDELVDAALRGMIDSLDRHSRYYGPDEVERLRRETRGRFRGLGVVFRRPVIDGQILFPFPGSPAERSGLRVGDTIVAIDGETVASMEDREQGGIQLRIRAAGGRPIEFAVRALDGSTREVVVTPDSVVDPSVRHARFVDDERGIGYVALRSFTSRTPDELDAELERLRAAGLDALVLDLRWNPGGMLDAAVSIANRFVSEGTLVTTRTRSGERVAEADPDEAYFAGLPLVLLVDRDSASASEVLSGALQDHRVAVVVGEPTYGKGSVQTLNEFDSVPAVVKLTTAYYLTPSGRRIERSDDPEGASGIAPDVLVDVTDDVHLALRGFLESYSPPHEAREAIRDWEDSLGKPVVPLRPQDPQLDAAVALLAGELDRAGDAR